MDRSLGEFMNGATTAHHRASRVPGVNKAAVELLICPHCGGELRENGGSLICSKGHTANIARQGYVSLLGRDGGTHTADSAEMVAARERFLATGHYQPLVAALVEAASGMTGEAVIDLGCGTGDYLAAVVGEDPDRIGIGVDNSKFAARRAAKRDGKISAIVADIWDGIPIRTDSAGLILNVFSPRNGEEIERILAPEGRLVVVTPRPEHLQELIGPFGMISVDPDKEERLERSLGPLADAASGRELVWEMKLSREEVRDLVEMGPSAGRMELAEMESALQALDEETTVTAAVIITTTSSEESQ